MQLVSVCQYGVAFGESVYLSTLYLSSESHLSIFAALLKAKRRQELQYFTKQVIRYFLKSLS